MFIPRYTTSPVQFTLEYNNAVSFDVALKSSIRCVHTTPHLEPSKAAVSIGTQLVRVRATDRGSTDVE